MKSTQSGAVWSRWWLRLHGYDSRLEVVWDVVNLQDEDMAAKAELYHAQARSLNGGEAEV